MHRNVLKIQELNEEETEIVSFFLSFFGLKNGGEEVKEA